MMIVDSDVIVEEKLRAILAYWEAKRPAADRLPARRDIDPVEIPELLKHVFLVDVLDDPPRYYCRLAGHLVCRIYDEELTGRHLDEIFSGEALAVIRRQFDESVTTAAPCYHANEHTLLRSGTVRFERILLPLSDDGDRVTMLLGGGAILPGEGRDAAAPPLPRGRFTELVGQRCPAG